DRQALGREPTGHCAGGMARAVEGTRQSNQRGPHIARTVAERRLPLIEPRRRQRRRRREAHVAPRQRGVDFVAYERTRLLRPHVMRAGDEGAELQSAAHLGIVVVGLRLQPGGVIGERFRRTTAYAAAPTCATAGSDTSSTTAPARSSALAACSTA